MGVNQSRKDFYKVLNYEQEALEAGFCSVAGLDEAGRGALCGPVVAAAVILNDNHLIDGVDDSKRLTAQRRESLYIDIINHVRHFGIGIGRADEIDEINILEATRLAMGRAIHKLCCEPDCLLLDAIELPRVDLHQVSIIKGDQKSHSIAAASILAKVVRDRIMAVWAKRYPVYGWSKNKGYGTRDHLAALKDHGPCEIHRKTFKGVIQYRGLFD